MEAMTTVAGEMTCPLWMTSEGRMFITAANGDDFELREVSGLDAGHPLFVDGAAYDATVDRGEYEWLATAHDDGLESYALEPVAGAVAIRVGEEAVARLREELEPMLVERPGCRAFEPAPGFVVIWHGMDPQVCDRIGLFLRRWKVPMSSRAMRIRAGGALDAMFEQRYAEAVHLGGLAPSMFRTSRTLKPHQEKAVVIGSVSDAVLNADQVGLGKGGEFVCTLLAKVERAIRCGRTRVSAYPFVVVVPSSMKAEIAHEILQWDNDAKVEVLSGRSAGEITPGTEFIVTNPDILKAWLPSILDAQPKGIVVDEAQMVNNPKSQRSSAVQKIADHVRRNTPDPIVILASATPFQNGPYELWGLLRLLDRAKEYGEYAYEMLERDGQPVTAQIDQGGGGYGWRRGGGGRFATVHFGGSPKLAFEARWCGGFADEHGHWQNRGSSNTAELFQLLAEDVLIRRLKSDVLSPLPPLYQHEVMVDLPGALREDYHRRETEFRDHICDRAVRQAAKEGTDPGYALRVLEGKLATSEAVMRVADLRRALGVAKVEVAVDWIRRFFDTDEITGGDPARSKLIVFVHHKDAQHRLVRHPELKRYGLVSITDSNTSMKGIQEAKEKFQKDPKTRLIICNSGAVAGHTLTAAHDTLMVELLYGPVATMQAAGRNWARFSEDFDPHEAHFHLMVARDSIDYATFHSNLVKKSLMNSFIDGDVIDEDLVKERSLSLDERQSIAWGLFEGLKRKDMTISS